MAKTKISEFSSTPANNTDIDSINIAEGCAPSNINDAIRELMAQLKDFQTGAVGDSFNGPIGSSTASTGAFTNITASGTLGVTGVATLGAGAILNTPASVTLTNATGLPISTGVSGLGTGVATALAVNVGSAGAPVVNGGALGTPSSGTVTNLTGTASININGTVGATTPTTGAFTTLAASSSVTLSGGTANGVTYLNGSKVLTSGSALTFDGTNLGITTGAGNAFLNIDAPSASNSGFAFKRSGTTDGAIYYLGASQAMRFDVANAEAMRLTSTGLGIGTSSPTHKVEASTSGNTYIGITSTTDNNAANRYKNSQRDWLVGALGGASGAFGIYDITGSTQRLTLDTSGNLGIGTSSPVAKVQGTRDGAPASSGNLVAPVLASAGDGSQGLAFGASTGDYTWIQSAFTNNAAASAASLRFYMGATERMRLDSAGNVGIGTSSPASKLDVYSTGNTTLTISGSSGTGGDVSEIDFLRIGSGVTSSIKAIRDGANNSGALTFYTANLGTNTERMRLDTSGNLGLGTSSPSQKLDVYGNVISVRDGTFNGLIGRGASVVSGGAATDLGITTTTGNILFSTGGSFAERARIDSSGNLLVGTTTVRGFVNFSKASGATPVLDVYNTNGASGDYAAVFALGANTNNTSSFFLNCTQPGVANRFAIYGNGTYATISDQRLKKNIETARDGYLDDVARLRVVKYNWNSQADGEAKELGVIAQELEQVFPGLIQESQADGADTAYKQIKTSVLPFILLKAIQELKAEFDAYKASHP